MCIKKLAKADEVNNSQGRKGSLTKNVMDKAIEASTKTSKAVKPAINQRFSLYSNLLTELDACGK